MLRPGDVINKVIINSGIIFAEIIHTHDDGRKYPASHIIWDKCVKKARELFLKNGKIVFCTMCESPLCAVNEAMVKESFRFRFKNNKVTTFSVKKLRHEEDF